MQPAARTRIISRHAVERWQERVERGASTRGPHRAARVPSRRPPAPHAASLDDGGSRAGPVLRLLGLPAGRMRAGPWSYRRHDCHARAMPRASLGADGAAPASRPASAALAHQTAPPGRRPGRL